LWCLHRPRDKAEWVVLPPLLAAFVSVCWTGNGVRSCRKRTAPPANVQ
jgi:hypothetical protein